MRQPVEIPQRLREGVLHDRGQNVQLSSIETFLDEAPLYSPGFSVGGEKTFAQEVAHPFHLNFGFVVIFRIGLQHVLNNGGISGNNSLLDTTQIKSKGVSEVFRVLRENPDGIEGHPSRIGKRAQSGNDWCFSHN